MFQFRVWRLASCNSLYVEVVISFFGDLSIHSAPLKGKKGFAFARLSATLQAGKGRELISHVYGKCEEVIADVRILTLNHS